ncbi:cytochrome p450 [Hirsutella rhossiliensis]|uniref:Cytochrome p450 domain-containing protein n=1 Tax=Hirsutella rhossiliensis TaxID=111463 RepID=A0A9P8N597_9HYPO|nr:cytochrome p450 domain-containing protein [Hirsutella rhossiliensis]KAH0967873.1 cytochrome p450 domain-containing protein [Hirsutella rhossiliensis]
MSAEAVAGNVDLALRAFLLVSREHVILVRAIAVLFVPWICWRCWMFIVYPLLHPQNPRQLPYWIPIVGHGFAFFKNSPAVLGRADEHFGGSKELYSLCLFGETIYVVTDPRHTVEVYKNTKNLTFEEFVIGILKQTGMSKAGIQSVYNPLPETKPGFPNPNGDPLSVLVRQIHMHQAYPGENLDILDSHFVAWFDGHFRFPAIQKTCATYAFPRGESELQVPLWKFCSEIQVQAAGECYFGDTLSKILYQYPSFLTGKLNAALKKMQRALQKYFEIPQSQRRGQLWQVNTMEDELRAIGVLEKDIGILFFNIFWGINTNSRKTAFWILSYLLHHPSEMDAVREETANAFRGDQLVHLEYLYEQCPRLNNIWHETLRVYSHAVSARSIKKDTVIGGKLLREGRRVMIPFRMLHMDESVWGDDVGAFRPARFAGKTAELTKSPSWRPFGGGKSLCSGRYVAKHLTFMFTAMALRRFDMARVGDGPFPEGDIGKPALGMMSIKKDQDYTIRLSARQDEAVH